MFKGFKAWWSRLHTFDQNTIRYSAFGFVAFVMFFVLIIGGGNIAYSVGTSINEEPPIPTVALTVVETTSRMEGDSAAAVAATPDGVKVLLYGNWVEGQRVDAYAYPGPAGTQSVYSVDEPDQGSGVYGWVGAAVGAVLWAMGLLFLFEWWNRRKERARTSRHIVNAALR